MIIFCKFWNKGFPIPGSIFRQIQSELRTVDLISDGYNLNLTKNKNAKIANYINGKTMKKNNNIAELKKVRLKIDDIDSKIIKLIADRFKEIHKVTKLKDDQDQIIDHERITHILKSVQTKAKKNKIDPDITTRIWQIFIQEAIKLEYSKIKKTR